jgi:hypothetical protein
MPIDQYLHFLLIAIILIKLDHMVWQHFLPTTTNIGKRTSGKNTA